MSDIKIEGYKVSSSPVGSGCTGQVFRAERKSDQENFVVKQFNSMAVDRPLMDFCFHQYQKLPPFDGVAGLETYQFDKSPYYTVTEYIEGVKLKDSGVHSESEAWALIHQLAASLGHAHKHGVFHANLHPGNIILTPGSEESSERLCVTDFCAGMIGDYHFIDLGENAGFAAPEQLAGLGKYYEGGAAEKWNVYSFGVIAYWLLKDRLPRGSEFMKQHILKIEENEGRPVAFDPAQFAAAVQEEVTVDWGRKVGKGEKEAGWRAIIEQCLDLDPAKRPVDMREIRNHFESLTIKFDLIEAEEKANAEIQEIENYYHGNSIKQRKKLISARAAATILAISWFAATFFLVTVLQRAIESGTKINKLGQLVENQKAQILSLDNMVEDTADNLRRSREAADTSFYQLTRANSGQTSLKELERVRVYYLKILDEVEAQKGIAKERARALHSLAHIESRLNRKDEAREHFEKAIECFLEAREEAGESGNDVDTVRRLADCYEYLGNMREDESASKSTEATRKAITYYKEVLDLEPGDNAVAMRLALLSFQYGQNLFKEKRVEEAINSYITAAVKIQELIDSGDIKVDNRDLDQIIAELQYHAAEALHNLKRHEDAFDAYIATIESIERLRDVQGYGSHETVMLARSFMALGDIMRESKTIKSEDKDQVYNEALRLVSPLNQDDPRNVEIATLTCRILSRIADLERESGNPRDGYHLSVRGIEGLIQALDSEPDNVTGFIQLAEARLNHLEFLKSDVPKSRVIALRGVSTAKHAHSLVTESIDAADEIVKEKLNKQLRHIFGSYYEICKRLGESKAASECSEYASFNVSLK